MVIAAGAIQKRLFLLAKAREESPTTKENDEHDFGMHLCSCQAHPILSGSQNQIYIYPTLQPNSRYQGSSQTQG